MADLSFDSLDPTDFEEFCFELMVDMGFVNVDWRKGTDLTSSPADRGRDIVAQLQRTDVDAAVHMETWFVDCKHQRAGVGPDRVQGLLTWAAAERPHVALVITSGFLTNGCKDMLTDYEERNRPPFRIKRWERPQVERLTDKRDDLIRRFLLTGMRNQAEVLEAEQECFDKVWYERSSVSEERRIERGEPIDSGLLYTIRTARREVEERRGLDQLGPYSDFEWGMVNGKLSALRWVLGEEWDFLDT